MSAPLVEDERDGLLSFLEHQRQAVRNAAHGLRDDQARLRPTPSALSIGGIVTHLAYAERGWTDRIEGLPLGNASVSELLPSAAASTTWRGVCRCRRRRGTPIPSDAPSDGYCSTSSRRLHGMPDMPTSSARHSTAR